MIRRHRRVRRLSREAGFALARLMPSKKKSMSTPRILAMSTSRLDADPVRALLVFLDLLEGQAEHIAKLFLAHADRNTAHAHPAADFLIDRAGRLLHCGLSPLPKLTQRQGSVYLRKGRSAPAAYSQETLSRSTSVAVKDKPASLPIKSNGIPQLADRSVENAFDSQRQSRPRFGHRDRRPPRCPCWRRAREAGLPRRRAGGPGRNAGRARASGRTRHRW